jgi:hypothetical protein
MYNQDYIWEVVYDMDGVGLADFLNDFSKTDRYLSSQHGEKVWNEYGFEFSAWSSWRQEVSYYFGGFFDAIEELQINLSEDNVIEILVFAVCSVLHLTDINKAIKIPENYDKFLFC